MAGILGLGSSASQGLNQERIDKMKAAEAKGKVDPYDKKLETWEKELEKISEIDIKTKELLDTIKDFDLFATGTNKFDQVTANTSGTSAVFDAVDLGSLTEGTNKVDIKQLAQRDVYQTSKFDDKDVQIDGGNDDGDKISIKVGKETFDFSTENKTYEQLAKDINANKNLTASIEQVSDDNFRLVIKSTGAGVANKLTISQTGVDFGLDDTNNHILEAKNMKATVDGVEYDVSDNKITIQGSLTMTAVEVGISTISLQKDTSAIFPTLKEFVAKYNELITLVDEEMYSDDSSLNDPGSIKTMMKNIKDSLFRNYGLQTNPEDKDKNIFNYGFGIDKSGKLSIQEDVFNKALVDDLDGLKELFVGVAEEEGLATSLKTYLDDLDGYNGLLTSYGDHMVEVKTKYKEEKEKAQKLLDAKYSFMESQYAAYTSIIAKMEASFGGLKMMMEQSTAK
jgi:flagellar hook-associated protein 2